MCNLRFFHEHERSLSQNSRGSPEEKLNIIKNWISLPRISNLRIFSNFRLIYEPENSHQLFRKEVSPFRKWVKYEKNPAKICDLNSKNMKLTKAQRLASSTLDSLRLSLYPAGKIWLLMRPITFVMKIKVHLCYKSLESSHLELNPFRGHPERMSSSKTRI